MKKYISIEKMEKMFEFWGAKHGEHRRLLIFLIKTEDELSEFMQNFYEGDIIKNMILYQRFKRRKYSLDIEVYSDMFVADDIGATETIFQEPLTRTDINMLKRYNINHRELYNRLKDNPIGSYAELVRSNRRPLPKRTYVDDFLIQL